MKTLLFTLEYPLLHQNAGQAFYGGVANYYGNLVKHWPGINNIVVLDNNEGKLIKNWFWPKWLPAIWYLLQIVNKKKIEHILVGHILPLGTVAWLTARFIKVKYSVFLHGMDFAFSCRTTKKKSLTRKILKRADNIICVNSYVAGLVSDVLGADQAEKIIVVNPGIEISKKVEVTRPTAAQQAGAGSKNNALIKKYNLENKIVLFSIGRLVKRKGFDKVIEVLPKVLKEVPNLVYIIAGEGPDRAYLENKGNLDQNALIFLGKITDEEKWNWLNLCDIFITISRNIKGDFEGFGIVYLEANLVRKPVIAGDSGGVRDAVQNGVNGLLVNSEDIDEIADTIIKLVKDKNLRKKLGEQGRERAIKEFSWEKQVKKIYNIIIRKTDL